MLRKRDCRAADLACRGNAHVIICPTRHVFKLVNAVVCEVLLPNSFAGLRKEIAAPGIIPRHPETPYGIVFKGAVDVWNWAVFRERDDFVQSRFADGLVEIICIGLVIACAVVNIDTDDVHVFVSRIPVSVEGAVVVTNGGVCIDVPNPKCVFHTVYVHHAVEYEFVQGLVTVCAGYTPPEPASRSFVQRTPNDCDSGILQDQEVLGKTIDVRKHQLIFFGSGVDFLACFVREGFRVIKTSVV